MTKQSAAYRRKFRKVTRRQQGTARGYQLIRRWRPPAEQPQPEAQA